MCPWISFRDVHKVLTVSQCVFQFCQDFSLVGFLLLVPSLFLIRFHFWVRYLVPPGSVPGPAKCSVLGSGDRGPVLCFVPCFFVRGAVRGG
jgi:hypothetical protein